MPVGQIHGDMEQSDRIRELDRFKQGDITILVASDVAARGLDVPGVSHVINFDMPWHPDDYVHRIGRTGRGGASGRAFTLVTKEDAEAIETIEKLTGLKIERLSSQGGAADAGPEQESPPAAAKAPRTKPAAKPRAAKVQETKAKPAPAPSAPPKPKAAPDHGDDGWNGPVPDFLARGFN
jgi:superfamily II DNA/RNA helicase